MVMPLKILKLVVWLWNISRLLEALSAQTPETADGKLTLTLQMFWSSSPQNQIKAAAEGWGMAQWQSAI